MKKIIYCSVVLLIISVFISYSMDFKFCVLGKKGTIQVKSTKSKKYVDLKTGDKLFPNDNLLVENSSYVGLVHINGKTIEITKPGKYKIATLSSEAEGKKTSVLPRIAEVMFNKSDQNDILSTDGHKNKMNSAGYIERGIGDSKIQTLSPLKNNLLSSNVTLCWSSFPGNHEYEFKLTSRFNKVLLTKTSADTCISFDANSLKLEKDTYYFWTVNLTSDKSFKSQESCFMILSDKAIASIQDTLKLMKQEMGNNNTAASKLVYAVFYEQNNLLDEAGLAYKQAVELAPGVNDYVVLYNDFLLRTKTIEQ